jgi:ATP-dependent exoDNAse (exonuclease V) beta subunit
MIRFKHTPLDLGYSDLDVVESPEFGRRYITPEGAQYSSITTILGSKKNESLENWKAAVGEQEAARVCHNAATRGTALHNIVERYLNNDDDYFLKTDMPHHRSLFNSIRPILDRNIDEVFLQEAALYSDTLKSAGRVDLVARYCGQPSIIDFKTSRRYKKCNEISNYFQQATAYSIMLQERTGVKAQQIVIIMAVDDSPKPIVFIEKTKNYVAPLFETIQDFYKNR